MDSLLVAAKTWSNEGDSSGNRGVFTDSRITLRCGRVLTGNNEPMLVLDGVPIDIRYLVVINPEDIESVKILKSASATAIYGPDGANGAILVTWKKKDKRIVIHDSISGSPVSGSSVNIVPKNVETSIKIYPSLVSKGRIVHIAFNEVAPRNLTVKIISLSGEVMANQIVRNTNKGQVFDISTDSRWASAPYFVKLFYENGKSAASGKIVVQ